MSAAQQASPNDIKIYEAVAAFKGTLKEAVAHVAAEYGYKIPSVYGMRRRAELWLNAQKAPQPIMPEGQHLKGVSSFIDGDGNIIRQWIKTDKAKADWQALINAALDRAAHIEPIAPTPSAKTDHATTTTVYPVADWHVGLATATACGWTLDKAAEAYRDAFAQLVKGSTSANALIVVLGDFTHTDNDKNVTPRSGAKLDVSGSYAEIVQTAMQLVVDVIALAQQQHAVVEVAYLAGNHDGATATVMQAVLRHLYANSPNVTVHASGMFFYKPIGRTLLGFTHGHLTKRDDLPMIMATDQPQLWGATRYRVFHTGHIHHKTVTEYRGCVVESHQAPTPRDAWHDDSGYRSNRAMCSITYDASGEKVRTTVNL